MEGRCEVRRANMLGDRDEIRRRATQAALEMTRRMVTA
jgi:nicotinamide mononucleotide (NMN) deamidase PncC